MYDLGPVPDAATDLEYAVPLEYVGLCPTPEAETEGDKYFGPVPDDKAGFE